MIFLAALVAYHGTFTGPFVFDDIDSITENPTIRQFSTALSPPHGTLSAGGLTVSGRPVLNFSLALNYAVSGLQVWSYHALNLLIHAGAGLALFGIVRRTLRRAPLRDRFGDAAMPVALVSALLWTLHPLQTESVTYVVQRAESLMGLFYLLTLYGFIRSTEPDASPAWPTLSIAVCLLGMATKEVMVSAPVIVLLYDRAFVAGSFRNAWRQRRPFYLGLAGTWLLLVWMVAGTHGRGDTAGFDAGVAWWTYALTQCRAIVHYLALTVWPRSLVFDYGTEVIAPTTAIAPSVILVLTLAAATGFAVRRCPALGLLGVWFFAILAPTSSVVPVASQIMAEHRMYLPLAAVIVFGVTGFHAVLGRRSPLIFLLVAIGLGVLTARRNEAYRSELILWDDTVAKHPESARPQNNLGWVLLGRDRPPDAISHFNEALRISPRYNEARFNRGRAFLALNRPSDAIADFEAVLKSDPAYAKVHNYLGAALLKLDRPAEALLHFQAALRIEPDDRDALINVGYVLRAQGQLPEAVNKFEEALRRDPTSATAHHNLGVTLFQLGRVPEAITHYEAALRLRPDLVAAHYDAGIALNQVGRAAEAAVHFNEALRLEPNDANRQYNFANLLFKAGNLPEAIRHYEAAVRLKPDFALAHNNLGNAWLKLGRAAEAIPHYDAALKIQPDYAEAHNNLGNALEQLGRLSEARSHYETALQLRPDFGAALENLERLRAAPPTAKP